MNGIYVLSLFIFLVSCTSTSDKSRIPNATSKTAEVLNHQEVETEYGTLFVKWENKQDLSDGGDQVLDHKAVHVEISVQCKNSNEVVKVLEHDVCDYDISIARGNTVYVNWFDQLRAVAKLSAQRKLKTIKENDRHCNTSIVQEIDVKILCENL